MSLRLGPIGRLAGENARHVPNSMLGFQPSILFSGQMSAVTSDSDALKGEAPKFERRFRAVLVADVVGYTRLMEAAELETHTRYRALRVGVADPTIIFHRGEIVKNTATDSSRCLKARRMPSAARRSCSTK